MVQDLVQTSIECRLIGFSRSIIGAILRLCVGLGLHRASHRTASLDPYNAELGKRFFWCAYSFDRSVCAMPVRQS